MSHGNVFSNLKAYAPHSQHFIDLFVSLEMFHVIPKTMSIFGKFTISPSLVEMGCS
jgi:hypothetical protein